jgi:hypothetical protein
VGVVIHNALFDIGHLIRAGVEPGQIECTAQAARLALGRRRGKLAQVVNFYLKVTLDKDEQKSDWASPALSVDQVQYAARDVIWLWRVCTPLYQAIRAQSAPYRIQCDAVRAVAGMNLMGVLLDLDAHDAVVEELKQQDADACDAYRAACREIGRDDLAEGKIPRTDAEITEVIKSMIPVDEIRALDWRLTHKTRELSMSKVELWKALKYPPIGAIIDLKDV